MSSLGMEFRSSTPTSDISSKGMPPHLSDILPLVSTNKLDRDKQNMVESRYNDTSHDRQFCYIETHIKAELGPNFT